MSNIVEAVKKASINKKNQVINYVDINYINKYLSKNNKATDLDLSRSN